MNQESTTQADARQRVFAAADELYNQAEREKFPTVDAVRRASKADMNSVSLFMKEWRHAQTTQAAPVRAVLIPEAVQAAHAAALAMTWAQATDLANQNLQTTQAGWEAERLELNELSAEISAGYEAVTAEAVAARTELATITAELDAECQRHTAATEAAAQHAAELQNQLAAAKAATVTAEARTVEIEHRVDDLKTALSESQAAATAAAIANKAQADRLDAALAELAAAKATTAAAEQSHAATTEAATIRLIKIETERDEARATAAEAREQAAKLQGSTEAMQSQIAEFMHALADRQQAHELVKK